MIYIYICFFLITSDAWLIESMEVVSLDTEDQLYMLFVKQVSWNYK